MANYTAADVKKLRELTGAGMMDCKKALDEADGDFDKAVEILRIKGAKDVGKRAERTAANGLVAHSPRRRCSSSTARPTSSPRTTDFVALPQSSSSVAKTVKPADVEALLAAELDGKTVADASRSSAKRIGEKIVLAASRTRRPVAVYLHRKARTCRRRSACWSSTPARPTTPRPPTPAAPRMQIAAMRPKYLTRDEVPAETSSRTSAASPRPPPARRASPSRRCPRSSRAGSTASSRTSSCSSSRR
jgi:elongation factor Ts